MANPYAEAIAEVGFGAFGLLPSADQKGSYWLSCFLKEALGQKQNIYSETVTKSRERHFKVKLSTLDALSNVNSWDELPDKYQVLMPN